MKNKQAVWGAMAVAAAAVLTACGGGGDPTPYGAIAWDASTPAAYIATNFVSQDQANAGAVERCGGGACAVVLEFAGKGSCGALAVGGGASLVIGVASAGTQADAEAAAVASCSSNGGAGCAIPSAIPGKCQ